MSEIRKDLIGSLKAKFDEIAAIPCKDLSWEEGQMQINMMVSIAGCIAGLEKGPRPHHHHHSRPRPTEEKPDMKRPESEPELDEEAIIIAIEAEDPLF